MEVKPTEVSPEPANMWGYWRDDKGIIDALRLQYQEMIEKDPRLKAALTMVEVAEAAIDQIMKEHGV